MRAEASPSSRRRPWLLALLLVGAHIAVAALLVMVALTVSLAVGGPEIGRDELSRLGAAPRLAVAGAVVPVIIAATAAFVVALSARPQNAWKAPAIGMVASVALCAIALAFLHAPAPVAGG
ncbi:hypothetical protein [Leifsonia sp. TF02-11]|uniref:hypothetical protein n=1 Tax=Leifsonia sp. TF02-11 TaxID=2815212 RepID=UPI001AA122CB|nr:hypothetical protein [Leifsonia sp. TF02-11]MBO1740168.1 hypothetical protein [Leifsonia sp. TF02-11]